MWGYEIVVGNAAHWKHNLRNDDDLRWRVDYIRYNPVKHGLVDSVKEWPYSTFHQYDRRCLYPIDWAGGGLGTGNDFGKRV